MFWLNPRVHMYQGIRPVFLNRWVATHFGSRHWLLGRRNLCFSTTIAINGSPNCLEFCSVGCLLQKVENHWSRGFWLTLCLLFCLVCRQPKRLRTADVDKLYHTAIHVQSGQFHFWLKFISIIFDNFMLANTHIKRNKLILPKLWLVFCQKMTF